MVKWRTKKFLYLDMETTGVDVVKHDVVQIAMILEREKEILGTFETYIRPVNWDDISGEALEKTGMTIEKLKTFPLPCVVYKELITFLNKHINKFDKDDKVYLVGYNVRFDLDFLVKFFNMNQDKYLGSYINWRMVDLMYYLHLHDALGNINLMNYKLETVARTYGMKFLDAHNAMADIKMTRELIHRFILI